MVEPMPRGVEMERKCSTKIRQMISSRAQLNAKGSEVAVGKPQRLFHASTPGIGSSFDVSMDGKRLLVNHADEETQAPLHLITDWLAELKK